MTSETPCLPGCYTTQFEPADHFGERVEHHAEGCPNSPKPAEPRKRVMIVGSGISAALAAVMTAKPAEPPACGCFGPCGNPDCCERCAEPQSEPPIDPEPWVKITDWHIKERPQHAMTGLCRAFKSLKAERDILKLALAEESGYLKRASAERDALKVECDELAANVCDYSELNTALKARVEELSESLLWATSSYEERVVILARREKRKEQEASNAR